MIELNKYYIKKAGYDTSSPELVQIINASTEAIKLAISKRLNLLLAYVQDLIINDNVEIYFQEID